MNGFRSIAAAVACTAALTFGSSAAADEYAGGYTFAAPAAVSYGVDSYGTGSYGTGSYGTGSYGTGEYAADSYGTGSYGTG